MTSERRQAVPGIFHLPDSYCFSFLCAAILLYYKCQRPSTAQLSYL